MRRRRRRYARIVTDCLKRGDRDTLTGMLLDGTITAEWLISYEVGILRALRDRGMYFPRGYFIVPPADPDGTIRSCWQLLAAALNGDDVMAGALLQHIMSDPDEIDTALNSLTRQCIQAMQPFREVNR